MNTKQIIIKKFTLPRSPTFKAKDALQKRLSRANAAPLTQTELEEKRRKDREQQRMCPEMKKKQTSKNSNTDCRAKTKDALCRLQ